MKIIVSRGALRTDDGRKVCPRCAKRPLEPAQKYCPPCKQDYEADRRAGTTQMQLTAEELALVLSLRAVRET